MTESKKFLTIGEVVKGLHDEFPDLTISKVRFLEDRGLIRPYRTSGGYRKFSLQDINKLRALLHLQRDEYLPLNVIKEKMRDFNPETDDPRTFTARRGGTAETLSSEVPSSILLEEAQEKLGVPIEDIQELESFGVIQISDKEEGKFLDDTAIQLITLSRELRQFGIEPRHFRMYQNFAEREVSFLEQIFLPTLRQRNPEHRRKAEQSLEEFLDYSMQLKHLLLKNDLKNYLTPR